MQTGTTHWGSALKPGRQMDVAVVVPTMLRPTLGRALRSIFAQDFQGSVHILIGIDAHDGPADLAKELEALPANMAATVIDPGYSTGRRRGGLHDALGGSLRTVLSLLAHAPLVAYLDDDCWWSERHLSSLREAIRTRDWAFSLRWYVAPKVPLPLGVDTLESIGPELGAYAKNEGGFCDTNTLMIDKTRCETAIAGWSRAQRGHPSGRGADRVVFATLLAHEKFGATGLPTAFYEINENDNMHKARTDYLRKKLKPLDGYARFMAGDFIAAATTFHQHAYLTGEPPHGLSWACSALLRAGDRQTASRIARAYPPGAEDLCWQALTEQVAPPLDAGRPDEACRIAFFRGQRLLADGDGAGARRWLEIAATHGATDLHERIAARADLRKLDDQAA